MEQAMTCCGGRCCWSAGTQKDGLEAKVSQQEIGPVYDKLSAVYDLWSVLTESRARTRAVELAGITDGQSILEVAVGTGHAFREIVKQNPGGRNMGIDLSEGMLARARRKITPLQSANTTLLQGTALDLPVTTGTVDILMNNYMFDLLSEQDMDRALAEFRRVLKPGGRLVLVNMTEGEGFGTGIYRFIYRLYPKALGGCRGVSLSERLTAQGFRVVTREYHQQLLFPSEVIAACT